MTIIKQFNRPKLAPTIDKNLSISAEISEGFSEFLIDIVLDVEKDDSTTVKKTAFRIKLPIIINGNTLQINNETYIFEGTAQNFSPGGLVPNLGLSKKGTKIDINNFLSLAGDLPAE